LSETNQNLAANANYYEQQIPAKNNIEESREYAVSFIRSDPFSALKAQGNINSANLNSIL
jgi:hypothetical protein